MQLSLSIQAQSTGSAVCNVAGYTEGFFNGVWNTSRRAADSAKALSAAGPTVYKGKAVSSLLFYNQTQCQNNRPCLEDLAEVFVQRARVLDPSGTLASRYEYFWESIGDGNPSLFQRLVQQFPQMLAIEATEAQDLASEMGTQLLYLATQPPTAADTARHEAMLDQLAKNGEMLLLVGHSQGTLFSYHGIHYITPKLGEGSVQGIYIAPAIYQAQLEGFPYFLSNTDVVINLLRQRVGAGSVPDPNLVLPISLNDLTGHTLVGTYLDKSRDGYKKISQQIETSLSELTPTTNQLCGGTPIQPPTTEPVYLPTLFAGLSIPKSNCTPKDPTGVVTIGANGDITGQGCLVGTDFPNGSTYTYSQSPTGINDYLHIHIGSLGTETLAEFGREILNPQSLVVQIRQPTGGSYNNGINFLWSYLVGDRLRIDSLARTKSVLGYISNRSCVAAVNNVRVATDAHIEIDASALSVKQGSTVIGSAPLSEFGTSSNIVYSENYGIFPGTTDQFALAASSQSSPPQTFRQVTVLLPHKLAPSQFQFNALSLAQPDGTRVSVSCNSPVP